MPTAKFAEEVAASSMPVLETRAFRAALGNFPTGVAIITTVYDGAPTGLTCNSFSSVSLDPPLVLWSLRKESRQVAAFRSARRFAVNLLADHHGPLSNRFASSKVADKFEGVPYTLGELGLPLLEGCVSRFECETHTEYDGGDHLIFVGRVVHFAADDDVAPLVFCRGGYRELGAQV
jgi:flavin reductase (DIM6/NTAB) family NADH-FMN oxidoreductase RutF